VHPTEVYRWFMELFVDSADWVMVPNVYGMGQFADGGQMMTKPYMSGSNYLNKMGNYPKGDWCEVWDGLYWRFVDRKRDLLTRNPRLSMMVKTLEKMDSERRDKIFAKAEDFIQSKTK
jgi:deoxyribodipyrimidine photolyase-related protein